MTKIIDLSQALGGENRKVHNLSGKERGLAVREAFQLDDADRKKEFVEIKVPEDIYSISSSFLLGLISESIQQYGEEFEKYYTFVASSKIIPQINHGISRSRAIASRHD